MRKIFFLTIAMILISACGRVVEKESIEIRNIQQLNTSENHTIIFEAFNKNNYPLECSLVSDMGDTKLRQGMGILKALEAKNVSAVLNFTQGTTTARIYAECIRK